MSSVSDNRLYAVSRCCVVHTQLGVMELRKEWIRVSESSSKDDMIDASNDLRKIGRNEYM